MSGPGIKLSGLTDYQACVDTVHRFVQGIDDNDRALAESAFTPDCEYDLTAVDAGGEPIGTFASRDAFVGQLMEHVGVLDTLHQITNVRVDVRGDDTAALTCMVLAQHFRPGEGPKPDKQGYLMGNRFNAELKKEEEGFWRIAKIKLRCQWAQGDVGAFTSQR
jgi:hypothetical protein